MFICSAFSFHIHLLADTQAFSLAWLLWTIPLLVRPWEKEKSIMRFHRKLKIELSNSWEYTWRPLSQHIEDNRYSTTTRNLGTPSLHAAQGACELVLVGGDQEEWTQPTRFQHGCECVYVSIIHSLVTPVRFPGPSHAGPGKDIFRGQHLLLFSMYMNNMCVHQHNCLSV